MIKIILNNKPVELDVDPQMPLLYALRDELQLTGTKFGCGAGQCGACTVHVNGKAMRSCVTPISAIAEQAITTIEGLADKQGNLGESAVQVAWREFKVPQCGYCQSGQMMSAAALLKAIPQPNDEQIIEHMQGNICRCGTYKRIKAAIKSAAGNTTDLAANNASPNTSPANTLPSNSLPTNNNGVEIFDARKFTHDSKGA
ncbi:(2Fe-2S)-binding protein [Colwellia psychrerythraea]|uniref:Isoquinoline 1-oxidoreductase n=1 Tax=Colwellia psychrerythraea TaxID=28229 RepID=A0A099L5B6_COLPS|nr:Isoquinoline 1-oxidoreductase [Colwellia psychrerythraea]